MEGDKQTFKHFKIMITKNQRALRMAHILHSHKPLYKWSDMVKYGWYFVRFSRMLANGVLHFSFFKEDGSIREARGTLSVHLIPRDDAPKNAPNYKPNFGAIPFYDIDKKEWRSFKIVNFIGFVSGYRLVNIDHAEGNYEKHEDITAELIKEKEKNQK